MSTADATGSETDEVAAASWLRAHGYPDAHVTPSEADEGIDVRANGAVAEVEAWSQPVGRPELHRLKSAAVSGERIFFFSRSGFTSAAHEYARRPDIDMALLVLTDSPMFGARPHGRSPSTGTTSRFRARVRKHRGVLSIVIVVALLVFIAWEFSGCIVNAGGTSHGSTLRGLGRSAATSVHEPRSVIGPWPQR